MKRFWYLQPWSSLFNQCFLIPQGIASDIVRYLAFFSYFTIQLAQLFLCCFADQPPEGKTVLEKVGRGECIPLPSKTSTPIQYLGKKMPEQLSCGFELLLSRHFSLLEEMMWFNSLHPPSLLTLTSLAHFGFLWGECEWVHVRLSLFSCIPSTRLTHFSGGKHHDCLESVTTQQRRHYLMQVSLPPQTWAWQHFSSSE